MKNNARLSVVRHKCLAENLVTLTIRRKFFAFRNFVFVELLYRSRTCINKLKMVPRGFDLLILFAESVECERREYFYFLTKACNLLMNKC